MVLMFFIISDRVFLSFRDDMVVQVVVFSFSFEIVHDGNRFFT